MRYRLQRLARILRTEEVWGWFMRALVLVAVLVVTLLSIQTAQNISAVEKQAVVVAGQAREIAIATQLRQADAIAGRRAGCDSENELRRALRAILEDSGRRGALRDDAQQAESRRQFLKQALESLAPRDCGAIT